MKRKANYLSWTALAAASAGARYCGVCSPSACVIEIAESYALVSADLFWRECNIFVVDPV
jgi:hypothetical protein